RVLVGGEGAVAVEADAPGPAEHADVELEQSSRVAAGRWDRMVLKALRVCACRQFPDLRLCASRVDVIDFALEGDGSRSLRYSHCGDRPRAQCSTGRNCEREESEHR